jgi:arabinan endo-1,5-alpha-L-arabinosidase
MRWGRRAALAALVVVLTLVAVQGATAASLATRAPALRIAPLFHRERFADPSVVSYPGGYVAVSTGYLAPRAVARSPRGPWHPVRAGLAGLPRWARSGQIWAADLVRARHGWLLYYSAVAHGRTRRCIGVAAARHALDRFRTIGKRPLVCPHRGAIDPSAFTRSNGGRYLLFKTQGNPTSIRLVRLTRDGRHRGRHAHARVLLRSRSTIENPVLVRHHRHLVLFTSEGYFGSCSYRTTWRRSRHLLGWRHARPHELLRRRNTRICGPGGADLLTAGRRQPIVYFHGWTCGHGRRPCPRRFQLGRAKRPWARRVLYAARLRWRRGVPHVHGYVRGGA